MVWELFISLSSLLSLPCFFFSTSSFSFVLQTPEKRQALPEEPAVKEKPEVTLLEIDAFAIACTPPGRPSFVRRE